MMIKVDIYLFISKTVICMVYVDYFICCAQSQYDIDNVINSFIEYGTSYNW